MFLYSILLLGSFIIPFSLSFDKKLRFYKQWKFVLPSIAIVAVFYIIFDIYYTKGGVWGFNPMYHSEFLINGLPIEECLFFIVIPYASIFLHEAFVLYFPSIKLNYKLARLISFGIITISVIVILFNYDKAYTLYAYSLLIVSLFISLFDKKRLASHFYITFLFILIPFFIVNGILTGTFIESEVVWYNNIENLGIRILTIPVEDFAYGFSMIFFNLLLIGKLKTMMSKDVI